MPSVAEAEEYPDSQQAATKRSNFDSILPLKDSKRSNRDPITVKSLNSVAMTPPSVFIEDCDKLVDTLKHKDETTDSVISDVDSSSSSS